MNRIPSFPIAALALCLSCTSTFASEPASHAVAIPDSGDAPLVFEWTGSVAAGAVGAATNNCPAATGDGHEIQLTIPAAGYGDSTVSLDFHVEWEPGTSVAGLVNLPDMILTVYKDGTEVASSDGGDPQENVGLLNPEAGTYTAVICPYVATSATPYRGSLTIKRQGKAECVTEPTKALAHSTLQSKQAGTNLNEEFAGWPNFDRFGFENQNKSTAIPKDFQGRLQDTLFDPALGLPTFLWARSDAKAEAVGPLTEREQLIARAKAHLRNEAKKLQLTAAMIDDAEVTNAQYNGNGPAVVRFQQRVNGTEVYARTLNVLIDRAGKPVAVSGYFAPVQAVGAYALGAPAAIASAWRSLGGTLEAGQLSLASKRGAYELYAAPRLTGTHLFERQPRAKRVYYARGNRLEPAYYLELFALARLDSSRSAYGFIISALDGSVLRRTNLVSKATEFTYRVFADADGIKQPFDEPTGNGYIPFTGRDPSDQPTPVSAIANLVTLAHGPISTSDPWLADGATQTTGNNVDSCIDSIDVQSGLAIPPPVNSCLPILEPRPGTTSANTFDYPIAAFDDPSTSDGKNAAAVNMFYTINWLHDWWYDHGFDEASGNAQTSNYGRGGVEGDVLLAQGQDASGRNNANMATPADGSSPVMQQYLFDGPAKGLVEITAPALGSIPFNIVYYGLKTFDYTGEAVIPSDGFDPGDDGCTGLTTPAVDLGLPVVGGVPGLPVPVVAPDPNLVGKIAIIRRGGGCPGSYKVRWALTSGASAVVLVHDADGPPPPLVNGDVPIDTPIGQPTSDLYRLPIVVISKADGARVKELLEAGTPVTMHLRRDESRDFDGTLDNLIIAHEFFHYVHHRLTVANSNQASSMSEGWGDINAFMLSARADDVMVPGNDKWQGAYAGATYVANNYFYGIRRAPYSTDFANNAFTFRHIADGEPTPDGGDGTLNSEVHNSGEIWANAMWNCYAGLLNTHPFEEARSRMQSYIISSLKMTPADATYTEARDAMLSVVLASDFEDYKVCSSGFAKRGMGLKAISPARASVDHVGVVEDYTEFVCPSAAVVTPTESSVATRFGRFGGALPLSLVLMLFGFAGLRRLRR